MCSCTIDEKRRSKRVVIVFFPCYLCGPAQSGLSGRWGKLDQSEGPEIIAACNTRSESCGSTTTFNILRCRLQLPRPPSFASLFLPSSAEATRCCDRIWLVRLGGPASGPPTHAERFPRPRRGRPRWSSPLVCVGPLRQAIDARGCANSCLDGKKVSIEGTILPWSSSGGSCRTDVG